MTQAAAASAGDELGNRSPLAGWGAWAAFCGVAGTAMLGASFLVVPVPPPMTASVARLVSYANSHHDLLLSVAWLEAAGNATFVAFLVILATTDVEGRRTARALTAVFGATVVAIGLIYAVSVIAYAEAAKTGGTQLGTVAVAYGLYAACEHAFLLAPPVFLPLGFALRGSSALGSRFSNTAVAFGVASVVLGVVGLFYARPNNAGAGGVAINVLLGLESIWVWAAAVVLCRRRTPRDRRADAIA